MFDPEMALVISLLLLYAAGFVTGLLLPGFATLLLGKLPDSSGSSSEGSSNKIKFPGVPIYQGEDQQASVEVQDQTVLLYPDNRS